MASLAILLTACTSDQRIDNDPTADITAAAEDAQGDIDTYAANALQPAPAPSRSRSAASSQEMPVPATGGDGPGDAQAAASVVRTYYGLLAEARYAPAYRLWDDGGAASRLSERAFADSFARFASYRAQVGQPGRVDAGAGQRYVEVPVQVTGELADGGRPFALAGSVTLHRTADFDGTTADQRAWRIRDAALRPRPEAAATVTASYRCAGDTRISVRFDRDVDTATVARDGREVAVLDGQRPASGIWYRGQGHELRGKGRDADYTAPGQPPVACSAQ